MSTLKKNIVYNFLYQLLILILPLITAPYLARVIGPQGVGVYSFSYSVAMYFTYITLLGLNNYGNRAIASVQDDYEKRSRVFCEIFTMQTMTFCISIALYLVYVGFFSVDKKAALIMLLWVLSSLFDINWFFFGMEQFKLTVTRNTIIKVLTVVAIFTFVKTKDDLYKYIAIMAVGIVLSQMCLWPFLKKYIHFVKPKFKDVVKHFKPNLMLFVPVIAISLYKIMDKVMLGYISNMKQVAYYENAEKIINITLAFITALGTVMLPRMTALISAKREEESSKYLDDSVMLVAAYTNAVMFGIFAVAQRFAVWFYGDEFAKSGTVMMYLAVTTVLIGVGNVIRTQYIIPNKKDSIYIVSAIIGAVVNLIVNALLIPHIASVGAAIGTIVAETCVFVYQIFCVRKDIHLLLYLKYEIVYIAIGAVMFGAIELLPVFKSDTVDLVLDVIVGATVYVLLAGLYIFLIKKKNLLHRS
ncbi:MAG: flippase [Ruminococcus sp.]|nr:flippase [Ruminococcus sp.]